MKLEHYIKQNKTSQSEVARLLRERGIRVTQGLVSQWVRGETRITLQAAVEIERLTGGAVSVYDWLPEKAAA